MAVTATAWYALLLGAGLTLLPLAVSGAGNGNGSVAIPTLDWEREQVGAPLILTGFLDMRAGVRTQNDPVEKRASLGEVRAQLDFYRDLGDSAWTVVTDLLIDLVQDDYTLYSSRGEGVIDVREANYITTLSDAVDLKAGRQILTWGTGDLLFINDLFPKDFRSFFLGRDTEYLKAPSDALKVSFFNRYANLDVVYTPQFDPDRYINGERLSFYSPVEGEIVGEDDVLKTDVPNDWFSDDELAMRLHHIVGSYELAGYAYDGYWKSPAGFDPLTGKGTFPSLRVFGASIRGAIAGGLGSVEIGDYQSRDDSRGTNPLIRNGEYRALVGYERELAHELTGGFQYYLEAMKDHDEYLESLPPGNPVADEYRHIVTVRLTQLLMNQNLELSLFVYHSPSDNDGYLRPKVRYKLSDSWLLETGANVFYGNEETTFFGQFEKNSNIYAAARYGF